MNGTPGTAAPLTIYCSRCGQPMAVAAEHVGRTVACPHCAEHLQPWRAAPAPYPPPPPPPMQGYDRARANYAPAGYSSRNKVVAGVLGILLGAFGIHRFYLGFIGIGILQIVLTIVTGGLAAVWGLVEGILCLTGQMKDVDGLPLRD